MSNEFTEYKCEEFFEEYYKNGLFHPTEAQQLFPHEKIIFDKENGQIQIGEIYDDHNLILCYRKENEGVWAQSNYDRSYQLISSTMKEFTEGWYQWSQNHWRSMTQQTIWSEVVNYYKLNIGRYNWKAYQLLEFTEECIRNPISNDLFVKARKNCLEISLKNGFIARPFENMATVYFDERENHYKTHFQSSFFNEHSSKYYGMNQSKMMIEGIREWIKSA